MKRDYQPLADPKDADAVRRLIGRLRQPDMPPLFAAVLFGSKARGDADDRSDIDVLIVCDIPGRLRTEAARAVHTIARRISGATGTDLQPWIVTRAELRRGRRTPMLVDALADGIPLWPGDLADVRLPFSRADAFYCAGCLLDWWQEGGPLVRRALARGDRRFAAARTRDDIARLAVAALLLTGDTRHRGSGSLQRFRERFIDTGVMLPDANRAIHWAQAAYPRGEWRGSAKPPPSRSAVQTVDQGIDAARDLEQLLLPWILHRMRRFASGAPA